MSDWRTRYGEKLIGADEAAGLVGDGMVVHFGCSSAAPRLLAPLIAERREELRDVIAYGDLLPFEGSWDRVDAHERHIEFRCCFLTPTNRPAHRAGRLAYTPATVYTMSRRWERDIGGEHGGPDIAYFRLSEPDERGICSFGATVWDSKIALRQAAVVVAEIEAGMVRTAGDNGVHVDEIDHLVEVPAGAPPPPRRTPPLRDPEALAVIDVAGAHAAEMVRDGDTLEIGLGAASNAVTSHLASKRDLGYHSELTGPGIAQLHDAGVFTGRRKSRDSGKMVVTALPASPEEREIIARHFDEWELYGVDYIHDPAVIASQSRMTSINTAIQIDLTGQIVFDSIGPVMHSGPGGQLEFVIGAVYSHGGRSIHVLPSTAGRGGEHSRIVAELPAGAIVGVPRYLADFVITEHGVASLMGKSERARAEELIAIAHPDQRADLRAHARDRGLL